VWDEICGLGFDRLICFGAVTTHIMNLGTGAKRCAWRCVMLPARCLTRTIARNLIPQPCLIKDVRKVMRFQKRGILDAFTPQQAAQSLSFLKLDGHAYHLWPRISA
jgi:hypothetical protein